MKIGIDARLINQTGIGRYIRNLIQELASIDNKNIYVIYLGSDSFDKFKLPSPLWKKRLIRVRWHTITEQLILPIIFLFDKLDLLHVPYFTAPLLYPKKLLLTIHDLTILHYPTGRASQLPTYLYYIKWFAYYFLLWVGVHKANHIYTVSKTTKSDIIKSLKIPESKISVTYEGYTLHTQQKNQTILVDKKIVNRIDKLENYLLYVGNAYPHKNLETFVESYILYRKQNFQKKLKIVFVGKKDVFYHRMESYLANKPYTEDMIFWGEATDYELTVLYTHAISLVFPSISEGFGLPAIEAIELGCPVICSDIAVFRELLGTLPVYVNTLDKLAIVKAIEKIVINPLKYKPDEKLWKVLSTTFQWKLMALETLAVYQKIGNEVKVSQI